MDLSLILNPMDTAWSRQSSSMLIVPDVYHTQQRRKVYTCYLSKCEKTFSRKSDLSRHEKIHTGERPYLCDWEYCGKTFIQRSALAIHYRTHTGERPHSCDYPNCCRSFSDSSSLARHKRSHTGKKPYECTFPNCGKRFTRKTTLKKHQTVNHHVEHESKVEHFSIRVETTLSPISVTTSMSEPATPTSSVFTSIQQHWSEKSTRTTMTHNALSLDL